MVCAGLQYFNGLSWGTLLKLTPVLPIKLGYVRNQNNHQHQHSGIKTWTDSVNERY